MLIEQNLVRFLYMLLMLLFSQSFRIPLGAVGYYIVAKYTPMAPDGECGESVYVISERAVESKLFFFLYSCIFLGYIDGECNLAYLVNEIYVINVACLVVFVEIVIHIFFLISLQCSFELRSMIRRKKSRTQ